MTWFENKFIKVRNGKLYLGGKEAKNLAEENGTPLFIYSREQILSNFRFLKRVFSHRFHLEVRICYAMKANSNPEILKLLEKEGAWIDAVSPNEIKRASQAGFPSERIIFTGTSLSAEDIKRAFRFKNMIFNIDAEEQLESMKELKDSLFPKKEFRVSVRWNPGIGTGFDHKAITAGKVSTDGTPIKFGIEEKKVTSVFYKAAKYGFLPIALHQHLGSGWVKKDLELVKRAVEKMVKKAIELEKAGIQLEFLDFGGGFSLPYSEKQEPFPVEEYADFIRKTVSQSGLKIKAIALEPGKYIVGNAGVLLLRVEYVKKSYGNIFACVNSGTLNAIPRTVIYPQAEHPILNCAQIESDSLEPVTVAGNLCETGDVFAKGVLMPVPRKGDILAILYAGAYCRSMASNYNSRDIPPEVIL